MHNTIFALFCIVSVGMNAFAVPVAHARGARRPAMRISRSLKDSAIPQTAAFELETFSKTKEGLVPRDYLSDLIWYLLGLTVGAFLDFVYNNLGLITDMINNGQTRLLQAMTGVDPATKEELRQIIEISLEEARDIVADIIEKLQRVLPSLTAESKSVNSDPNDIIRIILGMTLEEFLTLIKDTLERSDSVMVSTTSSLREIAARVSPAIAEMLRTTTAEMERARDAIRPVLTNIYTVLPGTPVVLAEAA